VSDKVKVNDSGMRCDEKRNADETNAKRAERVAPDTGTKKPKRVKDSPEVRAAIARLKAADKTLGKL